MAEYLNFVAKIHRMPEYPWQCLNFLGTGHGYATGFGTSRYVLLVRFSFLILIGRFVTLDVWSYVTFTPMHHPMIMVSSADFGGYHQGSDLDTEEP